MAQRTLSTFSRTTSEAGRARTGKAENMGYEQQLPRSLSMITILGLSFAILGVPCGVSTTMAIGLTDGGPVTVLYGWIIVSLISLCISASLAEICSVFPTSGGVYYWSHLLSTPEYATVASWITGWLGLVGNWTVTLSINFSFALLILCAISMFDDTYVAKDWHIVLMFWAVMLLCMVINIYGNKWLDKLNTICIWWTCASVIIILIALLTKSGKAEKRSGKYVFSHYDAAPSGWPSGWAFFVGLLQAAYTFTGYGMVASMCDEVQNPEREVPKAMVLSVAAAAVTGIIYIVPVLFVLPDIGMLLEAPLGQPIPVLFKTVTGSSGGGFGLLFLLLGIFLFSGVGSLTAASRCTWAFARDGAIPFSNLWVRVDKKRDVPIMALLLSTVVDMILGLIYFGSAAAFNAFTGCATICLSVSYGIPILISLFRGRKMVENAPFSLGKFGFIINIITVVWIAFAVVLFTMPTAIPVTASTMNYASVVFAAFTFISALWYVLWGRENYKGPKVTAADLGFVSDSDSDGTTVSVPPMEEKKQPLPPPPHQPQPQRQDSTSGSSLGLSLGEKRASLPPAVIEPSHDT
ncbi:hypothetical protein FRB95_005301 [Tulasnella sp. JGI-2019a]|nr:hypothetical protein FRB93_005556 [Tulasnella sp. JGI-2019a]KAG9029459.1 hypothetical protein FRB95_005301 [Tulasnella sp. JGI-2019a]